jgi:hypothetical protein
MKQRKIVISLAVIGAIAAPFVFHTYKARPISNVWLPLTAEEKEEQGAWVKSTNDCQTFESGANPTTSRETYDDWVRGCRTWQKALEEGGMYGRGPSTWLYLALNAVVAVQAFVVIFGLSYLLSALARRYWQWLKT